MNLIRLIALAVLFWLLYRLILTLLQKTQRPASRPDESEKSDTMVRCDRCDLHIPLSQALERGGKYYCCIEHRDAADNWQRDEE